MDSERKEIVGVGFGPANLALAIALLERSGAAGPSLADRSVFFERQHRFGWHRGMLIEGATMQVSFLKDLVTMRNPASPYSFVRYLQDRGRLAEFINRKTVFPYRVEFHDYLAWAAERMANLVRYDAEVVAVRPYLENGVANWLDVDVRVAGTTQTHRTRNVVIGMGLVPRMPDGIADSDRVWHSAELLPRLAGFDGGRLGSFAVVGAGQSAAEVAGYLHQTHATADVHAIFSRFGYSVADDSPFANRIFDPDVVDDFHQAPDNVRDMLLRYHSGTNYSVVDLETTQALSDAVYRETLSGRRRLHLHNASRLRDLAETASGVRLTVEYLPRSRIETIEVDALIYATGYRPADPLPLLGELGAECKRDDQGRLVLERDFQVTTSDVLQCGLYVHGGQAEHTHGLSAGLLSTVAVRAGEICKSVTDHMM